MLKSAFDLGLSKHSSEASIPSTPLWGRPSLFTDNACWHGCHSRRCFGESLLAASVTRHRYTSPSPAEILIRGHGGHTAHTYAVLCSFWSHLNSNKKFIEEPNYTAPTAPMTWVIEFLTPSFPFLLSKSFSEGRAPTRWQVCGENLISGRKEWFPTFPAVPQSRQWNNW